MSTESAEFPSATLTLPDGRGVFVSYDSVNLDWVGMPSQRDRRAVDRAVYPRAATSAGAFCGALGIHLRAVPTAIREECARLEAVVAGAERFPCRCCKNVTLDRQGRYDICPVCDWEDDPVYDWREPDTPSGPNHCSLIEARALFAEIGSSSRRALERSRVRAALERELPAG